MLITDSPDELIPLFHQGRIFAYPTEAVYGLGCDPDNEAAALRLIKIKNRPIEKGLILIASDFSQVKKYLKPLTKEQVKLTLPSTTTYTFPALDSTPKWLTGKFNTLAVRITKHPLAHQLCHVLNSPLISTSANLSGQPPAKVLQEVINTNLPIDAILNGKTSGSSAPSIIRDGISGYILRS
ncbi:MAG: Sua5/YciO/YrdC/YwlC family protein [Thiotrichaceae bacterium]